MYIYLIGRILYVIATRPNVMHAMCQSASFQASPKSSHLLSVKRIYRYLKGTMEYGLWYPKGNHIDLYAFTDVDYAGCVDDRKSTSGAAFYLGGSVVSWSRKKQSKISLSTAKA